MPPEKQRKLTAKLQYLIGELTNIVAGGAKQSLEKNNMSFHISIPTIVIGKNHSLQHQENIPVLSVPFSFDNDPFVLEVSMKVKKQKG